MIYLRGECSYRRGGSVRRFNVGRVLVLDKPLEGGGEEGGGGEGGGGGGGGGGDDSTSVECLLSTTSPALIHLSKPRVMIWLSGSLTSKSTTLVV